MDPFVYTEKDTNNLMHRPGENEKEREIYLEHENCNTQG